MRRNLVLASAVVLCAFAADDQSLRFNSKQEMLFPEHYREWVWLSSGLGMSYDAHPQETASPNFDNVFVSPQAYREFMASGHWPTGTVFVLEIRAAKGQSSINRAGKFQGDVRGIETHVKQDTGWAFYGFDQDRKPSRIIPHSASCYSCHEQHGAVDTTFVQFYPTLIPVARDKHTLNEKEVSDNNGKETAH